MIRLVFVFICALVAAYAVYRIVAAARSGRVDWQGVALSIGFVMAAAWLRNVTEIGGIFG
ncbi:MAG: hypothetical protein WBF87_02675 [Mesorhizobium sp.]